MNYRLPLYERDNACSRDVAEAITGIVRKYGPDGLPLPITCAQVVEQLLVIDQTDTDGSLVPHRNAVLRKRRETFALDLHYSKETFRGGYKLFKEQSGLPVVPVSDWFFDNVYAEDESLRPYLDLMTDSELDLSQPRAGSPTFGVVVFPHGSDHALVGASLEQLARVNDGVQQATLDTIARCALGPTDEARKYAALTMRARLTMPEALSLTAGLKDEEEAA